MSLSSLRREIKKQADPPQAKFMQRYFKTGRGGYAEGDVFMGIRVPASRILAKKHAGSSLAEINLLLKSKYHEQRLIALLILVHNFQKAKQSEKARIYRFYLNSTRFVNNWDLVDLSAPKIVGAYLHDKPKDILNKLARSKNIWERRIAIVATYQFIYRHSFAKTLEIAKMLLEDRHDLIHKAVGWMLREVGKRDEKVLVKFLDKYRRQMPRTALRYAIERFPEKRRKEYLSK
ncbi:MAG: DNA alkylation repair protein [Candidatus Doudnabacteria bacterium]